MNLPQAVKDALYLAVVIILAIFFIRILWQFGLLILIVFGGYFVYTRFIKNNRNDRY